LRYLVLAALAALLLAATGADAAVFTSPTGVWNAPVASFSPVDASSAAYVRELAQEVASDETRRIGPWINTHCSTPVYTVPSTQPPVRVQSYFRYLTSLQAQFDAVPLPPNAQASDCGDHELAVWQPATDRYWDFWKLTRQPDGSWQAWWGGRMDRASTNPGWFANGFGASATSLPLLGGLIRPSELQSGAINHAVAFEIANPRSRFYAWPAQRTDGGDPNPSALPEGIRFRLDPTLNIAALNLPPVTRAIALAVQRYGMVLRDKTEHAVGFYAEEPKPGEPDPYPALYAGKTPAQLLASFPWSHLQALPVSTHDCDLLLGPVAFPVPSLCGLPDSLATALGGPSVPPPGGGSGSTRGSRTGGSNRPLVLRPACSVHAVAIAVRARRGFHLVRVDAYENGRRTRVLRRLRGRTILVSLPRPPHALLRVKLIVRTKSGRRHRRGVMRRVYLPCR
jgi:hypothetical protein